MPDVFLIIATIVGFGILLVGGVYLLVYYQHPDDHNDAYFPKFVVIGGFVLAGATVLLLPLDVANREGYAGMFLTVSQFLLMGGHIVFPIPHFPSETLYCNCNWTERK